ncbi:MAG: NADP-dependent malic enzyme [Dehalococcoidales bacterium]|nr:NADP-dependent malic enzyme [Dehalococcoidales bacterium]
MAQKVTKEELLAKAKKPAEDAMIMHAYYRGKMQTVPRAVVRDIKDFAVWYTPGVAAPCMAIKADRDKAYEYTSKWNTVAVVSDGTRVLGLGNIGPEAAMPVMEGKAMLFKYLGGVDAVAVCLDTKDPDEIIRTVKIIQPSFGGINLEDIENPKCFRILDTLRKECRIPVWHDDQQGTAAVTLAGMVNALKVVGKDIKKVKVTMVGVGAANVAIIRLLMAAGVDPDNMIIVDSKSTLHRDRADLEAKQAENPYKWDLAKRTNPDKVQGGIAEALVGRDVVISLSTPDPDTIKPAWLKKMNKNGIGFFCANPLPEIWPWDAKEAGLRVVATGRSDFPNQVNNSIGFPAIFRGTLDVKAKTITDEMCIAAAYELAKFAEEQGLSDEHIVPTMADSEVFVREAVAVGMKAIEQGVARENITREELTKRSGKMIRDARQTIDTLMKTGMIPPAPKGV